MTITKPGRRPNPPYAGRCFLCGCEAVHDLAEVLPCPTEGCASSIWFGMFHVTTPPVWRDRNDVPIMNYMQHWVEAVPAN